MAARPKVTHSLVQASAILGVHRNTLAKWIDQGCPVVTKADRSTGTEWEICIADVLDWRVKRAVDDAVARYQGGTDVVSLEEANRRRATANAIVAEVEADEILKSVVTVTDVIDQVTKEYAATRTQLQVVGSKVAGRAASMTNPAAIQELVDEAIIAALEALAYDEGLRADQGLSER